MDSSVFTYGSTYVDSSVFTYGMYVCRFQCIYVLYVHMYVQYLLTGFFSTRMWPFRTLIKC